MMIPLLLLAVVALSFANGANDNFKGVATLAGSGAMRYRTALAWATITTLAGSLTAVFLAGTLLKSFSSRGLVPNELVESLPYVASVAMGAGGTVLLATWLGLPISTTHGLVGALVGAGWAAGAEVNFANLGTAFLLPLLLSPVIAIVATSLCYLALHGLRRSLGVSAETCFCVGRETVEVVPLLGASLALVKVDELTISMGTQVTCRTRYQGRLLGIDVSTVVDALHMLSAGIVSFARGLNDTPKIAALLLLAPFLSGLGATAVVGIVMAVGGVLGARRVAEVMSKKITLMNHGQGFTANLLTGVLVIGASLAGWPVSTTHVSCGALFGIGAVTGQAQLRTILGILLAWVTTLPMGALVGGLSYLALRGLA